MKIGTVFISIFFIISWNISISQIVNTADVIICPSCAVNASILYEQTENVVSISPSNNQIAIVGNNSREKPGPRTAGAFVTNDGGATWSENYNVGLITGDPVVGIDNFGQFYFGGLANRVEAYKFDQSDLNNPALWNQQLIDVNSTCDKPHLWIDNYSGSDKLYYGYTRNYSTSTPNQQVVVKKADVSNFNSWSSEVIISNSVSSSFAHHGINLCTGPLGQVYATWCIYDTPFNSTFGTRDEDGIGFAKLDAVSFQLLYSTRFSTLIRGTRGSGLIGSSGTFTGNQITMFPSIACNQQNGNLYMVWTNIGVPGTNTGDPDIYFIMSTDEGANWSSPVRLNQDPINNNKNQFYATVACDPVTGTLAVGYLDSRNNHPLTDYYVSLSNDEGQNWYEYQVSDASFLNTFGASNDYTWVDIKNNYVIPVWNQFITDPTYNVDYDNAFTSPFSIACQDDINNLCNINENSFQFFRASNTITVAGDPTTCYYNLLAAGGDVAFQAGNYVKFQDGFHAEYGSTLHSYINTNCNLVGNLSGGSNQRILSQDNSDVSSDSGTKPDIINFKVYPNPAQNKLYVTFNLLNEAHINITLVDITGREIPILSKELDSGFYKQEVDLISSSLRSGIYYLKLSTDKNVQSLKFAKL